jgi:hypothetical protein
MATHTPMPSTLESGVRTRTLSARSSALVTSFSPSSPFSMRLRTSAIHRYPPGANTRCACRIRDHIPACEVTEPPPWASRCHATQLECSLRAPGDPMACTTCTIRTRVDTSTRGGCVCGGGANLAKEGTVVGTHQRQTEHHCIHAGVVQRRVCDVTRNHLLPGHPARVSSIPHPHSALWRRRMTVALGR